MKNTTNAFLGGLRTDLHPMATDSRTLTDALNATLITYNGNEMMLQNDMGNTKIQDSKTGNIMGLSEGFIPVGMKEHGGIMYIASVNKEGKGEIGTIPSPIYTLSYERIEDTWIQMLSDATGPLPNPVILNNKKLYPGDKFIVQLPLTVQNEKDFYYYSNSPFKGAKTKAPNRLLSLFENNKKIPGLYDVKLYSIYGTGMTELHKVESEPQVYYKTDKTMDISKYWFIDGSIKDFDVEYMHLSGALKTYPGLPPGRLAVKAQLEGINSFGLIKVMQCQQAKQIYSTAPYVHKSNNSYTLYFPGFEYKLESTRYIGKVEVVLYDQSTLDPIYTNEFHYNPKGGDTFNTTTKGIINTVVTQLQIRNNTVTDFYEVNTNKTPSRKEFSINTQYILNNSLFSCDIPKLENWYKLTVKYYDLYGGIIDVFDYSFNPYHILNSEKTYSGFRWKAAMYKRQYYDIKDTTSLLKIETTPVELKGAMNCSIKAYVPTDDPFSPDYNIETTGPCFKRQKDIYGGDSRPDNIYFYPKLAARHTRDLTFQDITANPISISYPDLSNLHYLYADNTFTFDPVDQNNITISWRLDSNLFVDNNATFSVRAFGTPYQQMHLVEEYNGEALFTEEGNLNPNTYYYGAERVIGNPTLTVSCNDKGKQIQILENAQITALVYDAATEYDEYGKFIPSGMTEIGAYAALTGIDKLQWKLELPSLSKYSLVTSFSLYGNSETKTNMLMGLNRTGQAVPAWEWGKNCIENLRNLNTSIITTFDQYPAYVPSKGSYQTVLDSGVYLINIQALGQENSNAVFKLDSFGEVLKINNHFVPTLFYLPTRQHVTLSWDDTNNLANIGLYQITRNILMSDNSTYFNSGSEYKILYYQDSSIKEGYEPILPLSATYYEQQVQCHKKTYDYYPGPQDQMQIDKHFIKNKDTWEFVNFVYTYDKNSPTEVTIPPVDGLSTDELTKLSYRTLNI